MQRLLKVDSDGNCISANPYYLKRLKCEGVSKSGQFKGSIARGDAESMLNTLKRCTNNPGQGHSVTLRKLVAGTQVVDTFWEFFSVSDDQGATTIHGIGYDISQRVALAQKTLEFSQKINSFIDSITDGFYSLDRN